MKNLIAIAGALVIVSTHAVATTVPQVKVPPPRVKITTPKADNPNGPWFPIHSFNSDTSAAVTPGSSASAGKIKLNKSNIIQHPDLCKRCGSGFVNPGTK